MTPSSTPGSTSPDDPMPWSDADPHDPSDATRPIPPVSRYTADSAPGDTAPLGRTPTGDEGPEDWSWYGDDDAQHTRPLPAVTAQHPAQEHPSTRPEPTAAGPGRAAGPASGFGGGPDDGHGYPAAGPHGATSSGWSSGVPDDPAARYARQRDEFGRLQLVPGFFGWLSAMALTWVLMALAGLAAAAAGFRLVDGMAGVVDDLASGSVAAWTAASALGVVEFLAFVGGGYAAGRMARFSGARQGVSVWLWSLFGRSVATVAGLLWADTVGLAPVGVSAQALIGDLLVPGLLAVAAVLLVDLLGAVLGGLWGVRYHRRVDRWGDAGR